MRGGEGRGGEGREGYFASTKIIIRLCLSAKYLPNRCH